MTVIKTAWGDVTHTVTTADVLALRDEIANRGRTGVDLRQSVRSELSAALQAQCPAPAAALSDAQHAQRQAKGFTHAMKAAHVAHQIAQLTEAHHEAYGAAKAARSPDVVDANGELSVHDAHHYAQKMHGKALWTEVDRLMTEAGL